VSTIESQSNAPTIEVRLFATLRKHHSPTIMVPLADNTTISDITGGLKIPESELAIILLNSRHADLDDPIAAGDVLSLFPPVGGG
jgi:sulfur-carrier protein